MYLASNTDRLSNSLRTVCLCLSEETRSCLNLRLGQALSVNKLGSNWVRNRRVPVNKFLVPFPKQKLLYFRKPFVFSLVLFDLFCGNLQYRWVYPERLFLRYIKSSSICLDFILTGSPFPFFLLGVLSSVNWKNMTWLEIVILIKHSVF